MATPNFLDLTQNFAQPGLGHSFEHLASQGKSYEQLRQELLSIDPSLDLNKIGSADANDLGTYFERLVNYDLQRQVGQVLGGATNSIHTEPFVFSFQNLGSNFPGPARFYDPPPQGRSIAWAINQSRFVLPIPPAEFSVELPGGPSTNHTINGLSYTHAGNIELDEISFEGVFPYLRPATKNDPWPKYIPDYVQTYKYRNPQRLITAFVNAHRSNQPLKFSVYAVNAANRIVNSDTGIVIRPMAVSVSSFSWDMGANKGGHRRDIHYNITLKRWRRQQICINNFVSGPQKTPGGNNPRPSDDRGGTPQYRKYTVKSGDYLIRIAQRLLGDGRRWREIYQMNRATIGPNPNLILPGQVLKIPRK